jgi:hypothetical protein
MNIGNRVITKRHKGIAKELWERSATVTAFLAKQPYPVQIRLDTEVKTKLGIPLQLVCVTEDMLTLKQ